jgi:hypothetical protein
MSTKSTIHFTENYHLYQEVFDNEHVYLDIENFDGLSLKINKLENKNDVSRILSLKIDEKVFKSIIEKYSEFLKTQNESK